jgi:hypothetical protein
MNTTPGASAIKQGNLNKGHLSERHVDITHGQMIDRIHGKDPGGKVGSPKTKVSKFASKEDANKAMTHALNHPAVQSAIKNTPNKGVSGLINVPLPPNSGVKKQVMKGPGFANTPQGKIPKQGPAQLINKDAKSVTVAVNKNKQGKTGFHTGFPGKG